jgi:hypothetical protein
MPNTRFKESIEIETIMMSRYHMDKLLNRLGAFAAGAVCDVPPRPTLSAPLVRLTEWCSCACSGQVHIGFVRCAALQLQPLYRRLVHGRVRQAGVRPLRLQFVAFRCVSLVQTRSALATRWHAAGIGREGLVLAFNCALSLVLSRADSRLDQPTSQDWCCRSRGPQCTSQGA